MFRTLGAAVAAITLVAAGPALAATKLTFTVKGELVSERGEFIPGVNTGVDPNLALNNTLTVSASIDASKVVSWGAYSVAFFSGSPSISGNDWKVTGGGMQWKISDDVDDGFPVYTLENGYYRPDGTFVGDVFYGAAPAIVFANGKVVGLIGNLLPSNSNARPQLQMGSWVGGSDSYYNDQPGDPIEHFGSHDQSLTHNFTISAGAGVYNNYYNSQGFNGVWDFAGSSVVTSGVPEPAAWAMMIVGFGLAGSTLRRRRLAWA